MLREPLPLLPLRVERDLRGPSGMRHWSHETDPGSVSSLVLPFSTLREDLPCFENGI